MIRTLVAFLLALSLTSPAAAEYLYGITATDLVVIDPNDPSNVTALGPHGLTGAAYLTWDPVRARLFGLTVLNLGPSMFDYDLVEYDLCSGAGSIVRELGLGAFEVLEYVESQGELVVSQGVLPTLSTTEFFTLDPDTGTLTPLVDVGFDNDFGVYDDVRDHLYIWDPNNTGLFQIVDLVTGGVTNLSASGTDDRDGAFSEEAGGIFLYDLATADLVQVQTTDGLAPITRVPRGAVAGDPIVGLAFTPVPPPTCGCAPLPGCIGAGKASLAVVEKKAGAEKLKLSLKKLQGATTATSFGDPLTPGTRYDVCVYDQTSQLIADLVVDRGGDLCGSKQKPCWKAKGDKGFAYKDPDAASSGVRKIAAKSGDTGKGKLQVQAGNKAKKNQNEMPTGIAAALENATAASVQVLVSDGLCFEGNLQDVKKADGAQFKAKGSGVSPD